MAEVAPAPTKAPKEKAASRPKKASPSVDELIVKAVSSSEDRSGVSLPALKKALAAGGYDVEKNNSRVKLAVKKLVEKEILLHTKGTGASDSFKLNKKQTEAKKIVPKAKKMAVKKPAAAKKPKKVAAKKVKKPAAAKKATKSPKRPTTPKRTTKSPKKAKAVKPKLPEAKKAGPKKE